MKWITICPLCAILPFLLLCLTTSCVNEDGSSCLNGSGNNGTLRDELPEINGISLNDGLHLHIVEGKEASLEINGGKNLIGNVRYEIDDGKLMLYDDNRCHWLRSAENLQLRLTVPSLTQIDHQGYGDITSDLLNFPDLRVTSTQATGNIQLQIENEHCAVVSNGDGNIILSGKTDLLSAGFFHTRGKLMAQWLFSKQAMITNDGYSEMHVRAVELLRVTIRREGSVYYYQEPIELITTQEGSGRIEFRR